MWITRPKHHIWWRNGGLTPIYGGFWKKVIHRGVCTKCHSCTHPVDNSRKLRLSGRISVLYLCTDVDNFATCTQVF